MPPARTSIWLHDPNVTASGKAGAVHKARSWEQTMVEWALGVGQFQAADLTGLRAVGWAGVTCPR